MARYQRNAIREDVWNFLLPALVVYVAGMAVCTVELAVTQEGEVEMTPLRAVGVIGVAVGLLHAVVGATWLRRQYSSTLVIREGHQLITSGPYRRVRHPIYLGALLVSFGIAVFAKSGIGFGVMALLVPLIRRRIRIEERLLTEHFGDDYRAYQRRTGMLLPRFGRRSSADGGGAA